MGHHGMREWVCSKAVKGAYWGSITAQGFGGSRHDYIGHLKAGGLGEAYSNAYGKHIRNSIWLNNCRFMFVTRARVAVVRSIHCVNAAKAMKLHWGVIYKARRRMHLHRIMSFISQLQCRQTPTCYIIDHFNVIHANDGMLLFQIHIHTIPRTRVNALKRGEGPTNQARRGVYKDGRTMNCKLGP